MVRVRPIEAGEMLCWRAHMERFHELGDAALVGESIRYVAEQDGSWVALLGWASASLRNGPRDSYVGWDARSRAANLHRVVNNARFLILPWGRHPNMASHVLAMNLRRLSQDWNDVYGHPVTLAETFIDTRHQGTCYRASNWIRVGVTKGWSKSGSSYRFHGQSKSVWLYPLVGNFKQELCKRAQARHISPEKNTMVLHVDRLPLQGEGGLFELLCDFVDPRKRRGVRHKIQAVLGTAVCAALSGARSFVAIAEWAAEQSTQTLIRFGCRRGKPPSRRTYERVLSRIDTRELDSRIGKWVAEQQGLPAGTGLAIDGKTVRGSRDGDHSALHLLSAVVHGSGEVVAQVAVDSKTNEITQVEPLFEGLDIQGTVVTSDALLTQREIARHLVEDKHADYVFTVKENQPTLRKDISDLFDSKEQEAKRLQGARDEPLETEAFPPSTSDL